MKLTTRRDAARAQNNPCAASCRSLPPEIVPGGLLCHRRPFISCNIWGYNLAPRSILEVCLLVAAGGGAAMDDTSAYTTLLWRHPAARKLICGSAPCCVVLVTQGRYLLWSMYAAGGTVVEEEIRPFISIKVAVQHSHTNKSAAFSPTYIFYPNKSTEVLWVNLNLQSN